jgi:hypothetical protein
MRRQDRPLWTEAPWIRIELTADLEADDSVEAKVLRVDRDGTVIDTGERIDVHNPPGGDTFPAGYRGYARYWPDRNAWEIVGCYCLSTCDCDLCGSRRPCLIERNISLDHGGNGVALPHAGSGVNSLNLVAVDQFGFDVFAGTCGEPNNDPLYICAFGTGSYTSGSDTWVFSAGFYRPVGNLTVRVRVWAVLNLGTAQYYGDIELSSTPNLPCPTDDEPWQIPVTMPKCSDFGGAGPGSIDVTLSVL